MARIEIDYGNPDGLSDEIGWAAEAYANGGSLLRNQRVAHSLGRLPIDHWASELAAGRGWSDNAQHLLGSLALPDEARSRFAA